MTPITSCQATFQNFTGYEDDLASLEENIRECYSEITKTSEQINLSVREEYVSRSELETIQKDFETSITQNSTEIRMDFTAVTDEIKENVATNQLLLEEYIRFKGALIELGKVGNAFTAELSNEELAFKENGQKMYPVGSIYLSVKNTNPSTYFGGTWVAWGSGRVPVGINTSDSNFNTVEKTGGASTVTLTTSQIPSHSHAKGTLSAAGGGAHSHNLKNQKAAWGLDGGGNRVLVDATSGYTAVTNKATTSADAHTHTISGSTAAAGSGGAHSNLQPYIVCYMWKRTA